MKTAPVLFVSHGAPTFALEPGRLGPELAALGKRLDVNAALVVSPHWQTRGGVRVMSAARPETVHDFGGFPPALYELRYPAPGAPEFAAAAARLLETAGFQAGLDDARGLDHGAWVPLRYLLPDANVPVFQVSLPAELDTAGAHRIGSALAPLRDEGVAIVGSGSMTHNLYEVFRGEGTDEAYARAFADWVREAVMRRDVDALIAYRERAPQAKRAHPTEEHYLPLLVALGASAKDETAKHIDGGMTYGVLSMDSYAWGTD